MRVGFLLVIFLIACKSVLGQIRYSTLVVKEGERFEFGESDILVVDTLVMQDSSSIVVNKLKKENFLHAKVMIVGKHCTIEGSGINGSNGRNGRVGSSPIGPCRDGTNGTNGTTGLDGGNGTHIHLYIQSVKIEDVLRINIVGGTGGNGGNGGNGGDGSPGTVHCNGGTGGDGGDGGPGGNGGNGGLVTINCQACPVSYEWIDKKIAIINYGGAEGAGGVRGAGGYPGSGPAGRSGKYGVMGDDGPRGQRGQRGNMNFVIDQ